MNRIRQWALIICALCWATTAQALSFEQFSQKQQVPIFVLDPESGAFLFVNDAAARFYGYSRQEMLKMSIDQINALTPTQVKEERARAAAEDRQYFIFRHRDKAGTVRTVEVYSAPYQLYGRTVLASIIHDISKQRALNQDLWHYQDRLEQMVDEQTAALEAAHYKERFWLLVSVIALLLFMALLVGFAVRLKGLNRHIAREHHRLEDIIRSTQVGTFEWRVQTGKVIINHRFARMLGYEIAELSPVTLDTWIDNIHPDDREDAQAAMEKTFRHEAPFYEAEFRMRKKDGGYIWVASRGNVMEWGRMGQPLRMMGTHTDISQRKEMADKITKAMEAAAEANQVKGQFLATMSHELRTPLMGILGAVEVIRRSDGVSTETKELLNDIQMCSESLELLLSDVLNLSRIEANALSVDIGTWEVTQLVRQAVSMYQGVAVEKHINLHADYPETEDLWYRLDDKRVRQVLSSLIGNACKFTPVHGEIRVKVSVEMRQESSTLETLVFEVEDNGIGIADWEQSKIFERFYQVDQSDRKRYDGTGLGLAIVHEIVQLMNGTVHVESEKNKGSRFTIHLPAEKTAPRMKQDRPSAVEVDKIGRDILLVEDNVVNSRIVKAILQKSGHRVVAVNNGIEAVQVSKQQAFDLILMDIQMPAMDGREAAQNIRMQAGPNQTTPILGFTADAVKENHEDFARYGIDGVLVKPIKASDLLQGISAVLENHEADVLGK